ncbi:MAG TPA: right-handed parallel beta-helix repeat-containing protein, partial [Candidatus Synoicihabitans sp.]|nr:right-handed parallel beta-helix repeat-containing protein [Candidatus Synoicihabitans sp.]
MAAPEALMRFSKVAAAAVFVLVSSLSAHAAELFVSTSGNDANAGTVTAPLRTISKASTLAKPGDVVTVRGGVYTGAVTISAKGTASARITFRAHPGEKAVIDGTGLSGSTVLVNLSRTEYVDFTGFEVRNSPYIGINVRNGRSTRIAGNEIHHNVRMAVYFGADTMGGSIDAIIENNVAYNNVLENQAHATSGGWAGTLVVTKTNGATIRGNRVYNNDGE